MTVHLCRLKIKDIDKHVKKKKIIKMKMKITFDSVCLYYMQYFQE